MSRNGNKRLPNLPAGMMTERNHREIASALERVFRHYNSGAGPARTDERTREFVFHMTDWYNDLARLSALYEDPAAFSQQTWNECVGQFLYHAVGHLAAAAKLNQTFLDMFGVTSAPVRQPRKPRKRLKRPAT